MSEIFISIKQLFLLDNASLHDEILTHLVSTQVRDVSSYRKGMLIVVFASKGKEVKRSEEK